MPTAIVAGALANKARNGGEAWVRLSWVLGLRRLGFDVAFVEVLDPAVRVAADGRRSDFAGCVNRAFFSSVIGRFGLRDSAWLLCEESGEIEGPPRAELTARAEDCDLLVNISGHLRRAELLSAARRRVYVDLDPGFTQMWHAERSGGFALEGHDHYVTVGTNIGGAGSSPVPRAGIEWIPTLPPTLVDEWAGLAAAPDSARVTTVANWRSPLGSPVAGGRSFSLKHHQFRRLLSLPGRCPELSFELALAIDPADRADREALIDAGWRLVDPLQAAGTPDDYRRYIGGSAAEFSVAQGVYVEARTGWFSDRSASYLAAGRPVIVQQTGVRGLPVGGPGMLTFSDLPTAVASLEAVFCDLRTQAEAARALARRHLDSDRVLGRLLERVGVAA